MFKITAIGNVGRDPETKPYGQAGKNLVKFSLGVSVGYGEKKETVWVDVVTFNEKVQDVIMKNVQKGSALYVEGEPRMQVWNDANGGDAKGKIEITLAHFEFVGAKRTNGDHSDGQRATAAAEPAPQTAAVASAPPPAAPKTTGTRKFPF